MEFELEGNESSVERVNYPWELFGFALITVLLPKIKQKKCCTIAIQPFQD